MAQRAQQTTNQTQTTTLPGAQQTNVDTLMRGALDQYNSGGPRFFPGQTFAGSNAQQDAARAGSQAYAGGVGGALASDAVANDRFWMNPANIFNPQNIPGFAAATKYVTDGTTRNLTEGILPSIRGGSMLNGNLGGSRQGIAEGLAAGRTSDALAGQLGQMAMGAYSQGLNMNNAAASRAPTTFALGNAPNSLVGSVGDALRSDSQQAIDAERERFNYEQMRPLLNLQTLQGLTGTAGQYGGTTTSSGRAGVSDGGAGVTQTIGTILTIAAMSHSMLKKDISEATGILAKLKSLPIYNWTYKHEGPPHIGPMAEDFRRVFGVGDGVTINLFDVLGVLLGAVKELAMEKAHA